MGFNKPAGCGKILIFIQIKCEISEKLDNEVLISHTANTLNEDQGYPNWNKNVELRGLYHQSKFKRNRSVNV